MSVRERQKLERRQRVDAAARSIFLEKGYEAATTREIAAQAGIGAGTLFAYAPDKATLLRRMVAVELNAVTAESLRSVPQDAPLIDQLLHVFRPRFRFWGADPVLSRHAMREFFSQQYAVHGIAAGERPELSLLNGLTALVERAQRAGTLVRNEDPSVVARLLLDLYLMENRDWILGERPEIENGVARLREVLALALRGLATNGDACAIEDDALEALITAARGLDAGALAEIARYAAFRKAATG